MLAILLPPYKQHQCPKAECLSFNIQLEFVTTGCRCFHTYSNVCVTASENSTHAQTALGSVRPRGASRLYDRTTVYVCIVCSCVRCCLLFTWKCSYAAGPLCPAGTITPEIKQWMMFRLQDCACDIHTVLCFALQAGGFSVPNRRTRSMMTVQKETLGEASAGTGLFQYSVMHHLHTHAIFFFSHTIHLMLNTDYHPSIMWMLCRPVFNWSFVHPNAATVPMCCP